MVGIRRSNAQSGDSGYADNPDQAYSIEEWVAMKDPLRVVAYGLPMAFPLRRTGGNPGLEEVYSTRVKPLIAQTLSQYRISSEVQILGFLHQPYQESKGQETLVVDTNDTNTSSWAAAANAILSLFSQNGAEEVVRRMQVEIRNPAKMYDDISQPLPDDEALIRTLKSIREELIDTASAVFGGMWSSIAFHSRVDGRDIYDTVPKPTVIVFCRPNSTCIFEAAEDRLMQLLNKVPMQVHLEILAGEISLAEGKPIFLDDIPQKPRNGASISIQGNTSDAGSLGGWLTLNLPKDKKRIKCALTCYHVVRAIEEDVAHYTDQNGVRLDDHRGQVAVEYPASYDANHTMKFLESSLQDSPAAHNMSEHATLSSLMANPSIGRVILASGNVINENSRMDWALIESPNTFSPNKPPPRSAFTSPGQLPPQPFQYFLNADSKVRNFAQVRAKEWVTKMGRTTNMTSAVVSKLSRSVQWVSGKITDEIEIVPEDYHFVRPGDSGSIVLNAHGELIGLLFGRECQSRAEDFGFITPIMAIQKHVKEMTDGGFLSLD